MWESILSVLLLVVGMGLLIKGAESCAIGIKNNEVITVPFADVSTKTRKFDKELYDIAHVLSL